MRTICGLVGLAAAGFLAASAHGLNVPTVSTPTVTAPSVSVPSVPVPIPKPTVPTPTVSTSTPVPVPPAPKPTLPSTTVAAPTPTATTAPKATAPAPTPAPVSSGAGGASATVTGGGARPAAAPTRSYGVAGASHTMHRGRAHASLPQLRRVIARFTLERAARVLISIEELAPVCRKLSTYLVKLPKGTHAFRFPVTHVTEVGTYRVTALLRDHKIFSVRARRMHKRVKLGGTANVCRTPATRTEFSLSTLGTLGATGFPAAARKGSSGQLHVKAAHGRKSAAPHTSGAQPPQKNPLVRAVSLTDAPHSLQPLLFTLLAIAIMLLALAAAPQRVLPAGRAAAIVATRRAYFAAAGIWLLVVVAIVTAFA